MINYVSIMLFIVGPVFCGLIIFATLSYLFVPIKITIPAATIVSILVAGLTLYYNSQSRGVIDNDNKVQSQFSKSGSEQQHRYQTISMSEHRENNYATWHQFYRDLHWHLHYLLHYCIFRVCSKLGTIHSLERVYANSDNSVRGWIALCFFLPGYGLVYL